MHLLSILVTLKLCIRNLLCSSKPVLLLLTYITHFWEITVQCKHSEYDMQQPFIKGLQWDVQYVMLQNCPKKLDNLYQLAIELDGLVYQMNKSKEEFLGSSKGKNYLILNSSHPFQNWNPILISGPPKFDPDGIDVHSIFNSEGELNPAEKHHHQKLNLCLYWDDQVTKWRPALLKKGKFIVSASMSAPKSTLGRADPQVWVPFSGVDPGTTFIPSLDNACMHLGSVPIPIPCSEPPFIAPHPIIPVLLKFPNQESIHTHTLIDSRSQYSLISKLFTCKYLLPTTLLDNLILIHAIDGKPLNNGFISHVIPANLCIQGHSKYKSFGIINMNFNLILGEITPELAFEEQERLLNLLWRRPAGLLHKKKKRPRLGTSSEVESWQGGTPSDSKGVDNASRSTAGTW